MRRLIGSAAVMAVAGVALLVPSVGASAAPVPVTSWSPTTSPGTYDYGTLTAGQSVSRTFTLINSGGSATSALTITLPGSAAFTKTADSCTGTSLGPRASCTVTVSYAPSAASQHDTATLTATALKAAADVSLTLQGASANVVSVTNPGSQTSAVGSPVSLQARASDSASGQTLTYAATGLPAGLSIDSSTGLISGTPTTAGTSSVTVTATDTTGASESGAFTWTVNPYAGGGESGTCQVVYATTSQWPGGFSATVTITNTGSSAISGWTLKFTFPDSQTITQLWNGSYAQVGENVTITNASYNGTIAPGGSASLGFNGSWTSSNAAPTAFTLNGSACTT